MGYVQNGIDIGPKCLRSLAFVLGHLGRRRPAHRGFETSLGVSEQNAEKLAEGTLDNVEHTPVRDPLASPGHHAGLAGMRQAQGLTLNPLTQQTRRAKALAGVRGKFQAATRASLGFRHRGGSGPTVFAETYRALRIRPRNLTRAV